MDRICLLVLVFGAGLTASAFGDVGDLARAMADDPAWTAMGRAELERGEVEWRSGRLQEARNHWYRARCWLDRTGGALPATREAMGRLMEAVQTALTPTSPPPQSTANAGRSGPPRKRKKAARPPSRPLDAVAVIRSAEAARASGQTEKAIRLMRIASGLPGGDSAAATADRWELEMSRVGDGGQAER